MAEPSSERSLYTDRIDAFAARHRDVTRRWSMVANLRLVLVVLIAIAAWRWWQARDAASATLVFAPVAVLLALVVIHARLRQERDGLSRLIRVNERAWARRKMRWDDAPLPPDAGVGRDHPFAWDLNIVGRASLAQRIGTPATRHGWEALYRLLLVPGASDVIPARQEAVAELAGEIDLHQQVEAAGLREDEALPDPGALVRWAASPAWLRPRLWLRVVSWLGPAAVVGLVLAWAAGLVTAAWIAIPVLVNGIVFALWGAPAAARVQAIVPLREAIGDYRDMCALVAAAEPRSARLREIDRALEGADGAVPRLTSLARIVSLAIPPGAIIYYPLQLAFLWDLHVLEALEGWQAQAGARIDGWLQALGEWEALAALSVLHRDDSGWAFATIDPSAREVEATALAHPLLPVGEAVANDVSVGPEGHFLFVTGSNMSGKSTLLRAIGANAVLAQAGAPVCASSLRMPPLGIWTCMRVEDSLERGVSFFMAELQRLKTVVDGVESEPDRMSLYLLDEILQGTNTGERQIASRRVLRSLVRQRAIGAVSSHDLELIEGSELERAAVPVHFSEMFTRDAAGPSMTFDYRLRPGPATTSNALALMELLGFGVEESQESRPG